MVDPNTVRRIARLAGVGPGDHVVEVGPGLGSLTLALLETGASVLAVEKDRHLLPVLNEVLGEAAGGVEVLAGDAMDLDWTAALAEAPSWVLVANLPYNVATPLICDLLDAVPAISRMLVMVQAEVAERLAAGPGSRVYGIPSVKVAYWGSAKVVGKVSAEVFTPRPRVDSALLEVVRHPGGAAVGGDSARIFELVRAGFGQRRKMLRRALAGLVAEPEFVAADVDPTARAESLDLQAWSRLAIASPGSATPGTE